MDGLNWVDGTHRSQSPAGAADAYLLLWCSVQKLQLSLVHRGVQKDPSTAFNRYHQHVCDVSWQALCRGLSELHMFPCPCNPSYAIYYYYSVTLAACHWLPLVEICPTACVTWTRVCLILCCGHDVCLTDNNSVYRPSHSYYVCVVAAWANVPGMCMSCIECTKQLVQPMHSMYQCVCARPAWSCGPFAAYMVRCNVPSASSTISSRQSKVTVTFVAAQYAAVEACRAWAIVATSSQYCSDVIGVLYAVLSTPMQPDCSLQPCALHAMLRPTFWPIACMHCRG